MPIKLRSSAREPNAISTSPFAIGAMSFGVSSIGVERSASEKSPIGLRAASKPERTAAPFPRFGKFSSKRVAIFVSDKILRAIPAVPSVDPSFTTINSLSAAFAARYSIVMRSVSLMRRSSLKQGMTIEKDGSITLSFRQSLPIDLHDKLAVWIDVAAVHAVCVKGQSYRAVFVDGNQTAAATKF